LRASENYIGRNALKLKTDLTFKEIFSVAFLHILAEFDSNYWSAIPKSESAAIVAPQ
jgi:hypothetical protein